MSSGPEFGLAAMYRVMKKSGAERVSDDAADELRKVLEEVAGRIAKQAVDLSLQSIIYQCKQVEAAYVI
jgi:histone H3/H4